MGVDRGRCRGAALASRHLNGKEAEQVQIAGTRTQHGEKARISFIEPCESHSAHPDIGDIGASFNMQRNSVEVALSRP